MHETSECYFLLSILLLGFRHGLDWDHVAALTDITRGQIATGGSATISISVLGLPFYYALGHSCMIFQLALVTRFLAVPAFAGALAEQAVGLTLVAFGLWILFRAGFDLHQGREVHGASKFGLLSSVFAKPFAYASGRFSSLAFLKPHVHGDGSAIFVSSPAAFLLGMLHGFGAETATQLLLLSSTSSMPGGPAAVTTLLVFCSGLIACNLLVAIAIRTGFLTAYSRRILSGALAFLAGSFSVYVGCCFLTGQSQSLPSLSASFGQIVPEFNMGVR